MKVVGVYHELGAAMRVSPLNFPNSLRKAAAKFRVTLALYRMRVLGESERRRGVLRASGKAVWTWRPVVAVDAGSMQIQSREGAALSRAETVL